MFSHYQRRRNRGGNGGARTRNAETAAVKVSLRPRSNTPISSALHSKTAGEQNSFEKPQMRQNSWRPQTPLRELTALPQTTRLMGIPPLPKNHTPVQPFGLRARLVLAMLISFRRHYAHYSNISSQYIPSRPVWSHFVDFKQFKVASVFITARCTLVQSAVLRSHVVCLSVRLSVCNVGGL